MAHGMTNGCVHINLEGKLIGKGRPRFTKSGHTYTPERTRAAEASLAWEAQQIMKGRGLQPFKRPIKLVISLVVSYPKSWSKKAIQEASPFYTGKPDADNQIKLVGDSLNGVVWEDDSQIVAIDFMRHRGVTDKIFIRVEEL